MRPLDAPDAAQIIEMHDRILEETGGERGVLSRSAIGSAVDRAVHGPFPRAPTLALRAAMLLRGICQDHPFADGNKRTSYEAAASLLRRNGWRLRASDAAATRFLLDVAQGHRSVAAIADWLAAHAEPLRGDGTKEGP